MAQVKVHIMNPSNWKKNHRSVAKQVEHLMELVLSDQSSDSFLNAVAQETYSASNYVDNEGRRSFVEPERIAEIIKTGQERDTSPDNILHLRIRLRAYAVCNRFTCKMGYVNPPSPIITTNLNWINKQRIRRTRKLDPVSVGSHWLHEWMHVAGFIHVGRVDRNDVAYKVGTLFRRYARKTIASSSSELIMHSSLSAMDSIPNLGKGYENTMKLMLRSGT